MTYGQEVRTWRVMTLKKSTPPTVQMVIKFQDGLAWYLVSSSPPPANSRIASHAGSWKYSPISDDCPGLGCLLLERGQTVETCASKAVSLETKIHRFWTPILFKPQGFSFDKSRKLYSFLQPLSTLQISNLLPEPKGRETLRRGVRFDARHEGNAERQRSDQYTTS